MIFVHGLTSSRTVWAPVTDLLVDELSGIHIDLRDHRDSTTASDYAMPSLVSDGHAVAEELGLRSPAVVENSLGARSPIDAIYAAVNAVRAVVTGHRSLRFADFAQVIRPFADPERFAALLLAFLEHR